MSKTKVLVNTAIEKLGRAKEAFGEADLAGKAGRIAGVGAGLALARKGGSAAVKTVRKHPVGAAVAAAAVAAVGAAVYLAKKKKAGAKPAAKKLARPAAKPAAKTAVAKKAPAKKAAKKAVKKAGR